MPPRLYLLLPAVLLCGLSCTASSQEIIDLEKAQADPDFAVQGEYVGEHKRDDGSVSKMGLQVIARGSGEFDMLGLKGGLPGAGWKRGDDSIRVAGKLEDGALKFSFQEQELVARFADGKMTIGDVENKRKIELKRIERKSPTLGAKPPAGAVVVFDGKNLDMFQGNVQSHLLDDGLLAGVTTKAEFDSYKLHLEFRLSWMPQARGQGRSNSGVYIHDCYECQVLDSFGLEGKNNECGGFYSIKEPDVNMCLPPMTWQTYDVDFTAPEYADGKKVSDARITFRHNGVVIHDDVELTHGTPGRKGEGPGPRALHLQGHGNKVLYRNIWIQKK